MITSKRPLIISGPCSAETEEQTMQTCLELAGSGRVDVLRAGIWKPRTNPGCFEGIGIKGLAWMANAKKATGLPIAVEVATGKHVESALEFGVDLLWIGARTTVNPFSVQDVAEALRGSDIPVLVKNPMHADLALWAGAVQRLQAVGVKQLGLIHRGFSSFGESRYRNAPMWHLVLEMRRKMPELPIICDPSHICGNRHLLQSVAQEAADLNFDGLMLESHCCPSQAWSDAAQQLTPKDLIELIDAINWRKVSADKPDFQEKLEAMRSQIDQYDAELLAILSKRMDITEQIGVIKRDNDVTILQASRWDEIVQRILDNSEQLQLSREFLHILMNAIHMESISRQNKVMNLR